jgi:hypothetical protein
MKQQKIKRSKNKIGDWDEYLNKKYGKIGTPTRIEFDKKALLHIREAINDMKNGRVEELKKEDILKFLEL